MSDFREGLRRLGMVVSVFAVGFTLGYQWSRDLELQSTAPVEIHYEVTPEAARYLVLKAVKGIPNEVQR